MLFIFTIPVVKQNKTSPTMNLYIRQEFTVLLENPIVLWTLLIILVIPPLTKRIWISAFASFLLWLSSIIQTTNIKINTISTCKAINFVIRIKSNFCSSSYYVYILIIIIIIYIIIITNTTTTKRSIGIRRRNGERIKTTRTTINITINFISYATLSYSVKI